MRSFPFYKQNDAMDCGPTCLRMILKYYGKQVNLNLLHDSSGVGRTGSSLLSLSETAEKFGLRTTSARLTFDQLMDDAPKPAVLFWDQYHFVVLAPSSTRKKIVVADPANGLMTYNRDDFNNKWISVNSDEPKGVALLLTPTSKFYEIESSGDDRTSWRLVSNYLVRYKSYVLQLFIGLFIGSILQLIFPYLTQSIVDTGINTQNLHFIQVILFAQFALLLGQTSVEIIRSRILLFVSTQINVSILSDFWIKLMRLPVEFFDSKQTGDILQRISDHHRIERFITGTALQTLFSCLNLVVFSVVLLLYSSSIFLVFLGGSFLYLLWIRLFLRQRRDLDYKKFSVSAKENSATMQLINGMTEIKLNNAEHLKRWEWEGIQASLFKLNFSSLSLTQYQQAGAFFINQGKNLLITYLVAVSVLDGHLTLGAMLAIQYIIGQLNAPIEQLIEFTLQAQEAKISLERLNEVHRLENEEKDEQLYSTRPLTDHAIKINGLSFAYRGSGNSPVLRNVDLEFPAGKTTAIVGVSGSGKTTLLKLVQKFYPNYEGSISIGDTNLKYLGFHFWRKISASVMQDGYIFSDTIERNIAVGDEIVDYSRLVYACRIANIQEFIESLPLGFNTKIGMEGNGISTGQKQRILIARAVYKDPAFLFFDEATNALDADNEMMILNNLNEFFKGRTVIVVAHRLSTVKNADKIIVLDRGEVVEEGTHRSLTDRKGAYYELVKNQLELGS